MNNDSLTVSDTPAEESVKCPECGEGAEWMEKRPKGNSGCRNGHVFPSEGVVGYRSVAFLLADAVEAADGILRAAIAYSPSARLDFLREVARRVEVYAGAVEYDG